MSTVPASELPADLPIDLPIVLIVAEAPADLCTLPPALAQHGLAARVLTKADMALAAIADGQVAAALIDVDLRQRDGFELCTLIATSAGSSHIPVFLMAARPDADGRRRSTDCGACDYLARPIDARAVAEKILVQLALRQSAIVRQPPMHALEVNYHAMLSHSPDAVVLMDIASGRLIDANHTACTMFGFSEHDLLGRPLAELCPPAQPDGEPSPDAIAARIRNVVNGAVRVFEITLQHRGGRHIDCEMRLVLLPTPSRQLMHARIVDITRRTMADRLRLGQGHLLELVARGAPLPQILDDLMKLIESQSEEVLCSVLLLDDDGVTIRPASAPSLPPAFMASLDGLAIGPNRGSCGSAMYECETVIVTDIMTDPRWEAYRDLALPYGLRACWSTPIFLDRHKVLGSFAMYYRDVRSPDDDDLRLIGVATHLAGIAIERTRRERELAQHREHLEELVAARTAELRLAKEKVELAQEELIRRGKLAALGALVAGVAHELNTPIGNSLVVATTMAQQTDDLTASLAEGVRRSHLEGYLARAGEAGGILVRNLQRAATLVASFKELAADHAGSQRRRFEVGELIDEMLPTMRIAAKGRPIRVACEVAPGLTMDSYPGPLAEALRGLFDNCLAHAFGDGRAGTIDISAERADDGAIVIAVADNGVGIAQEVAGRVYDPFFTTRLGAGGSGLGLHVVHNIVTGLLGGRIDLDSVPEQGARFTMLLPAVAPEPSGETSAAHA